MYRVIFTSILFLLCCKVFSQELISDVIEKRIIINASNNQEDSLKYFYNYAKLHNVVSNKMNTFLGDFYLQREKYRVALKYYEASYKRDSYNINTHYGLYICYGYLGMADQQNLLADKFTIAQCEFYQHKKSKLESVSFYSGTLLSNNFQKNKNIDLAGSNKYFGSIDRNGSLQYLYASAQYRVTNRFTVLASINSNKINSNQQFQYEYFTGNSIHYKRNRPVDLPVSEPQPPDSVVNETRFKDTTISYKFSQPIFYTQLSYLLTSSLKFKFTYGVTKTSFNVLDDTPYYFHSNDLRKIKITDIEATAGLIATYRKPHYEITCRFFAMPFSKFNLVPFVMPSDSDRTQFDLSATYYPFQKYSFSVRAQASYLNTQNSNSKFVFGYELNAMITKKLWLNALFQHNNFKNFIDLEGAVVYNIDDLIKNKMAIKVLYYVGKHLEISAQYGILQRSSTYTMVTKENAFPIKTKFKYNNQLINAGVKWIF